jgi:hypothetical protein
MLKREDHKGEFCDERITISAVKDLGQLRLYIS